MKTRFTQLKAFSIQEMVVVLIITTIVVGMAFSVLRLVQRQMGSIETIYQVKTDVNQLRQSLWIDFTRYSNIYLNAKTNLLYFWNETKQRTYYLSNDRYIGNEHFQIEYDSILYYFNNQQVTNGEIDAISIKISKKAGLQEIFVFKENTSATYLNQNE